ncbi:hypothetical protein TRFO_15415 [Tritrichomonas foetus]|uniref:Uncharacterized protein n=1 Tax=Tritrichomonas foetus TaxID=1144522 RepID=A0A1J4KSI6_9EUKA|nr:hypothetical protein TRFO_15415 [Tritrichomonas foetus]|eukprot:OHT14257.1 hypothetical protein TRFO_15415 [Tritrichomonas foetus]
MLHLFILSSLFYKNSYEQMPHDTRSHHKELDGSESHDRRITIIKKLADDLLLEKSRPKQSSDIPQKDIEEEENVRVITNDDIHFKPVRLPTQWNKNDNEDPSTVGKDRRFLGQLTNDDMKNQERKFRQQQFERRWKEQDKITAHERALSHNRNIHSKHEDLPNRQFMHMLTIFKTIYIIFKISKDSF